MCGVNVNWKCITFQMELSRSINLLLTVVPYPLFRLRSLVYQTLLNDWFQLAVFCSTPPSVVKRIWEGFSGLPLQHLCVNSWMSQVCVCYHDWVHSPQSGLSEGASTQCCHPTKQLFSEISNTNFTLLLLHGFGCWHGRNTSWLDKHDF